MNYLLARLIHCEECDGSFVGRRREYTNHKGEKQTALAYYCSHYLTQGPAGVCKSLPLDVAWIEGSVIDALRARFLDPQGWEELKARVVERIEARRRKNGLNPEVGAAKTAEFDRKIQNYYRAIGDGLDPMICKQLQQKKQEIEAELLKLRTQDYYVLAMEKNLAMLETFRRKLGDGFERLPFGVQRQIVLEFVESIRVRERREVVIHFKVAFANDGPVEAVGVARASPPPRVVIRRGRRVAAHRLHRRPQVVAGSTQARSRPASAISQK